MRRHAQSRLIHPRRGEPNVKRTIRLLREAGVSDISISTHDIDAYSDCDVSLLVHENNFHGYCDHNSGCWATAFYPTDEPACYLMGDVVFSPAAIRTIVNTQTNGIQFFASAPPFSNKYTKPYAEPFAFKVVDQKRFRAAINFVCANVSTGIFRRHPIAWELWQVINGDCVRQINYKNYVAINDYTCDIDEEKDAAKIEQYISD